MKIKVNYQMTDAQKAVWKITKHFSGEEFEPKPEMVLVKGLKSHAQVVREAWAKKAEKYSDATDKECIMATGMTPAQYQKTHKMAWNA